MSVYSLRVYVQDGFCGFSYNVKYSDEGATLGVSIPGLRVDVAKTDNKLPEDFVQALLKQGFNEAGVASLTKFLFSPEAFTANVDYINPENGRIQYIGNMQIKGKNLNITTVTYDDDDDDDESECEVSCICGFDKELKEEPDFDELVEQEEKRHFNETPCTCYVAVKDYEPVAVGPFHSKEEITKWRETRNDYGWTLLPCEGESDLKGKEVICYIRNLGMVSAGRWCYGHAYGPYASAEEHKKDITVDKYDSIDIRKLYSPELFDNREANVE